MSKAKKPATSKKKKGEKTGTKKEQILKLYKAGKTAPEIIKETKFKKNTVEGAINHFRQASELVGSGKVYNGEGKLVVKKKEAATPVKKKKPTVKKKPSKKKPVPKAPKKKAAPVTKPVVL